jgi:replication factor C subunit 2/4
MARGDDHATQPWVEKYRPRRLDDVTQQHETIRALKQLLYGSGGSSLTEKVASLPHLLFYGPPGTGKTTTALALCRELFQNITNKETLQNRVLELNASDERGIRVVREKIKRFAQSSIQESVDAQVPGFKIVILDEADAITADAQTALRRTIEVHSRTTRFVLICNYLSRVIPPLASRCAKFRFKALEDGAVIARLEHIARTEGMGPLPPEASRLLAKAAAGDLRRAVNLLQSCADWARSADGSQRVLEPEMVSEAACMVPASVVERFYDICVSRNEPVTACFEVLRGGYPVDELLRQTLELLLLDSGTPPAQVQMNDLQRSAIALHMACAEKYLCDGATEAVQLLAFVANCRSVLQASS